MTTIENTYCKVPWRIKIGYSANNDKHMEHRINVEKTNNIALFMPIIGSEVQGASFVF